MSHDYCTDPECGCGSWGSLRIKALEKELRRAKRAFRAAARVMSAEFKHIARREKDLDIVYDYKQSLIRRAKE
jgi:hypothetical protein